MNLKPNKTLTLVLVSGLIVASQQTSMAAPPTSKSQVQRALVSIKAEIVKGNGKISDIKLSKENSLAEALATARLETSKIQNKYDLSKKQQLEKRSLAQALLNDLSIFKVTVDNISACGPNFQTRCEKNQIIKVPTSSSLDVSFLIKLGGFVPLDEVAYQGALKSIQDIDAEILRLDSYLPSDKTSIESQYKSDVARIFKDADTQISDKEADLNILGKSKLAVERALKSSGSYSDAFKNAVMFEINLQNISEVADTSFQNIDSLLDLSVVKNAVKLAGQGEMIKRSYSGSKAKSYNKIFGNTFMDTYFQEILMKTTEIFKKFAK